MIITFPSSLSLVEAQQILTSTTRNVCSTCNNYVEHMSYCLVKKSKTINISFCKDWDRNIKEEKI